jgi:prephenate dehydrogenase
MIARQPDAEIAIVGLGVIGGSAALRLRERGTALRAYSTSAADCSLARDAGIVVAQTLDLAVRDVGLVLIAVPLDRIWRVAQEAIGAAASSATILHAGSLQRPEALHEIPELAQRVIGTHPVAGSHRSGFAAARPDLFRDATVYVEQRANPRQKEDAELFWSLAGAARVEYARATEHDAAMAWISHLPQLASTALAGTLAATAKELNARPGPGARDASRLAMSNFEMWRPILERAPAETVLALRALERKVERLRMAVEAKEWSEVEALWSDASAWRTSFEPRGDA